MLGEIHARLEATLGSETLARLHRSPVALIGTGLLGGQVLPHLAMLQVPLVIVDPDRVEPVNLGSQLFPADAIGERKAEVRAAQVKSWNPTCPARACVSRVEDVGLGALADCALLLTGLDSRASRLAVRSIAHRLGTPWIDAALAGDGRRELGTVSVYDPVRAEAACYACRYDAKRLAEIGREGRARGCPSWRGSDRPVTPPTLAASPLGGVVASFQVLLALRLLRGEGPELVGTQLQVRAGSAPGLRSVRLPRSARCCFPHEGAGHLRPLRTAAVATFGELLARAEAELGGAVSQVRLHGRVLALGLECPCCGDKREEEEFAHVRESVTDERLRCACGASEERVPRRFAESLEGGLAWRLADRRFEELGLPPDDVVSVAAAGREHHYVVRPADAARAHGAPGVARARDDAPARPSLAVARAPGAGRGRRLPDDVARAVGDGFRRGESPEEEAR